MKRILTVVLALVLVMSMIVPASALVLKRGDSGTNVSNLQLALNTQGFSLTVDGKYGAATAYAVQQYQAAHGLKVDGKAGPLTQAALGLSLVSNVTTDNTVVSSGILKTGSTGSEVLALQNALIALGYPVGTADGRYGTKTYHAVVLFQQRNGLKVDGKAGPVTQTKLYSGSAVAYSSTNVTPVTGNLTKLTLSTTSPRVGDTVTAYIVPSTATASYTWYREDGTPLAYGQSYTVQKSDLNTRIYCVAVGTGSSTGTVSTVPTAVTELTAEDAAKQYLTGTVTLKSSAAVGEVLTPSIYLNPTMNLNELYFTWYVGGVATSSARTLSVTSAMVGKDIRVVISVINDDRAADDQILGSLSSNYSTVRAQSADSAAGGTGDGETGVIQTLYGTVTIPSEASVGDVITPTVSLNAPDTALVYSWYMNTVFIGSYKTLTITDSMVGRDIHLVVTTASNSGYTGKIGSNYTQVKSSVQGSKTLLNGTVTLPERTTVGQTITATLSLNASDVDYAWTVNGTVVSRNASLVVTADMAGEHIYLTVSAKDSDDTYWGSVKSTGSTFVYVDN